MRPGSCIWIIALLAIGGTFCLPSARAQDLFDQISPIRPIEFEITEPGQSPLFVLKTEPAVLGHGETPASATSQNEQRETLHQTSADAPSTKKTSHEKRGTRGADAREKLQHSLARQGGATEHERDDLTAEVLRVTRWTAVVIALGAIAIVVMKHWGVRPGRMTPGTTMKVIETLELGRKQGVHLIEVGAERFLLAADQSGVKSMVLVPRWSTFDSMTEEFQQSQDAVETIPLNRPSGEKGRLAA